MYSRIFKPLKTECFFIFGPRGVGKSTWLKQNFPESLYLDLLDSDLYRSLLARPKRLEDLIQNHPSEWVIIDEIQKNPDLLNHVHRLISSEKQKFILTGSSARKLKKAGVNLLAGRLRTLYFHPLTVAELGKDFNLQKSLKFGHLPEAYSSEEPGLYLSSYIKTYLKEEIEQEGLVRNLPSFARFLESISFSHGQVLSVSSLAEDCQVDRKVVENYLKILEDLMIGFRVPVFSKRAKRRMAVQSKFYFFDTGLYQTIRPRGPLDSPEEISGPALESLVWQELRALNDYHRWGFNIFTWRTHDKKEVDLILYGEKGLISIEVKRSERVREDDLHALKIFRQDYPSAKAIFLYGGRQESVEAGIKIIPVEKFLREPGKHISL